MFTSDFDYDLPTQLIAQTPLEPRDASRLMVINRRSGELFHEHFFDLGKFLHPGDMLVLNETRVFPARLFGNKLPTGGKVELLLLRRQASTEWEALVGGKRSQPGLRIQFEGGLEAEIISMMEGPRRLVRFDREIEEYLDTYGHTPLPPYIHIPLKDPARYQTVYASKTGSAAAPTAGLHFTPSLIEDLKCEGIRFAWITLHVGLDTFAPVTEKSPFEHKIHTEWCQLSTQAAQLINQTANEGGRVIAVGTTSVRTLESAALHSSEKKRVSPFSGNTDLFIIPGYQFQAVDGLITNFHLPKSTLIMLVSAFAGRDLILRAYQVAIQEKYRFYSFGDVMLII